MDIGSVLINSTMVDSEDCGYFYDGGGDDRGLSSTPGVDTGRPPPCEVVAAV